MRIDLDALVFNLGTPDANGTYWYITEMDGWDGPSLRQSFQGATTKHGGVLVESLLDTRAVTLKGVAKSTTESIFWSAYNYLLGITNNLVFDRNLVVYESPTAKRLGVIRAGAPRISFVGVGAFDFEIPLIARNPLKYLVTADSMAYSVGQTSPLTNAGTFDTAPVVTTTSAGTVIIRNNTTGQKFSTGNVSLPAGTVIDMGARTIYSGTTNLYNALTTTSVWWALRPGINQVYNYGTASVSVAFNSAWI